MPESKVQEAERPVAWALASRLQGELLLPGDDGYAEARAVWNAAIDRYPAMIVRCRDAADVQAAVAFAREHALAISVRSGGHSPAGFGTIDGGMVIDLSLMKGITIDPIRRTARLEPGLSWAEVAQAAQPYGLALTSGDTGSVGVGGLLLGGGMGWMVRKYGHTSLSNAETPFMGSSININQTYGRNSMIYYRFAFQDSQTEEWSWKTTPLTSLQAALQLLRAFSALPQDSIRVFTASSTEELNEMLGYENNNLASGSATASQFLQERKLAGAERAQSVSEQQVSRSAGQTRADVDTWAKELWEKHMVIGSARATQPGASVATSSLLRESIATNGAFASLGISLLEQKRLEIELGVGSDHDTPYRFTLPVSMTERLAWIGLQARVQAGESLS